MKKTSLLLIVLIICSCTKEKEKSILTDTQLSSKAEELYFKDQKWRRVRTCLITTNVETKTIENMNPNSKKGLLASQLFYNDIIEKTDTENINELFELIDKYGFPGMERLNHKFPVCLVFVHSQPKHFPKIIEIVNREHELGNMNDWEKDRVLWHVERNREGFWAAADKAIWYGGDKEIIKYFLK